jgi:hypothetical protein
MPSDIYEKPHWAFTFNWPIAPRVNWTRWVRLTKCGIGYFGCSSAKNETYTLFVFGWPVAKWERLEYHNRSDAERAEHYLNEWSKCEKELRGLRLIVMGDSMNADVKKLIRDSMGVDFTEGRS